MSHTAVSGCVNTRKVLFRIISIAFMAAALSGLIFILSVVFIIDFTARIWSFYLVLFGSIMLSVASVFFFFAAEKIGEKQKKQIHNISIIYFVMYVILLCCFVFFVKAYMNGEEYKFEYNPRWLVGSTGNLVPFKVIFSFVKKAVVYHSSLLPILFDLGGNFVAYMPLAFFLPSLSRSYATFDFFLPVIVFAAAFVELFQGMFSLGTFCVDDLFLGVAGAVTVFFIMKIEVINRFMKNSGIYLEN